VLERHHYDPGLVVPGTCTIPPGSGGPPCVVTWGAELPGGLDVPRQVQMKINMGENATAVELPAGAVPPRPPPVLPRSVGVAGGWSGMGEGRMGKNPGRAVAGERGSQGSPHGRAGGQVDLWSGRNLSAAEALRPHASLLYALPCAEGPTGGSCR
jgi:hypothetical protein